MNKVLGFLGVVIVVVFIYENINKNDDKLEIDEFTTDFLDQPSSEFSENSFKCDGRQYCSQMTSYEEAKFFLKNCPNTKMDGDNDGEPCERQF